MKKNIPPNNIWPKKAVYCTVFLQYNVYALRSLTVIDWPEEVGSDWSNLSSWHWELRISGRERHNEILSLATCSKRKNFLCRKAWLRIRTTLMWIRIQIFTRTGIPCQSDAMMRICATALHLERPRPYTAPLWASKAPEFWRQCGTGSRFWL